MVFVFILVVVFVERLYVVGWLWKYCYYILLKCYIVVVLGIWILVVVICCFYLFFWFKFILGVVYIVIVVFLFVLFIVVCFVYSVLWFWIKYWRWCWRGVEKDKRFVIMLFFIIGIFIVIWMFFEVIIIIVYFCYYCKNLFYRFVYVIKLF